MSFVFKKKFNKRNKIKIERILIFFIAVSSALATMEGRLYWAVPGTGLFVSEGTTAGTTQVTTFAGAALLIGNCCQATSCPDFAQT